MKRRHLTRRGKALRSLAVLALALAALLAVTAGEDRSLFADQALRDMENKHFIAQTRTVSRIRPDALDDVCDVMRVGRNEDVLALSLLKKREGVWSAEHNMIVGTTGGLPAYAAALAVEGESGMYYFVCGLVNDGDIERVTVIFDYGDGGLDYMPQTFSNEFGIFKAHGERFFAACFPKSGEGDVPYTVHLECADAGGNVIYDTWERGDHY